MYHNVNLVRRDRLDLYDTRDASHPYNTFYEPATIIFLGPVDLVKRKCTDLVWVIVLIVVGVISMGLVFSIYDNVDFDRFYHGYDFRGDLCGLYPVSDKKYMYFFDPLQTGGIGMCVDQCPTQSNLDYCFYDTDGITILGDYCYKTYATNVYLDKFCMPFTTNQYRSAIETTIKGYFYTLRYLAHDIYGAVDIILAGYLASIFIGFIYMVTLLIKKLNFVMVWVYALLAPSGFVLIFLYFFQTEYDRAVKQNCKSGQDEFDCLGTRKYTMEIVKYLFISACAIYLIVLVVNRKKIVETGRDIQVLLAPFRKTHSMKFVPFFVSSIQLVGIVFVYASVVGIMASGKRTVLAAPSSFPNSDYVDLHVQSYLFYLIPILFILLIVFLQTFYIFQKFCYAFAVQVWYFSRQKSILDRPSSRGIVFCLWKHMGTCVKGAVYGLLNWVFRSLQRIFKRYLIRIKEDNRDSKLLAFWLSCCKPFSYAYEYFSKYQCNMTIMHTALYGENWANGSEKSHYLFQRNLSRTARFAPLFGYHRIIGMVFSSSCLYFFIYFFTVDSTKQLLIGGTMEQLYFPWAAAFMCFLVGLYLPQNFTMSFDVVIESMLFCIVADEEMFLGRERFCEEFILDYLNSITKETIKKGLITVARKDQQDSKLDDNLGLDNLKPKEEVKRPPTPPPIIEESSSSEEEDVDAVDLFAAKDRQDEEERKSQYSEPPQESSSSSEEDLPPPKPKEEEGFRFKKLDLADIKNEQRESDEEDEVQEDFGMVSKKKNVQYDEEDDDDIILDHDSPKAKQSSPKNN